MLLKGDPQEVINFLEVHGGWVPSSLEVAEVIMHKTITAAVDLPMDYRRKSKHWLTVHGYYSLDDGDLL